MKKLEKITPWQEDFAKWYIDVITQADLMSYAPIKGTIYYRHHGFSIWDKIRQIVTYNLSFKNVKNVYLPSLIPQSFILREKEHVEGFAPELLTITHAGEKELAEKIYIRPTSEVLFADFFKKEIDLNNKLPLIYAQWTSVVRWEKTTNPFLRNTEFLWQEGHTAFANAYEAKQNAIEMIDFYHHFLKNYLAIPTILGEKTPRERFAGAEQTYTVEAMMLNGRALQSGTSHYLGQNFSKSFDITFKNIENQLENVYQSSWGISTRLLGAIVMSHSDDRGLVLPPKIAPNQIDILVFYGNKNPELKQVAKNLAQILKNNKITVNINDDDNQQVGFKIADSEVHGTPIRIEIGPRDYANNLITIVRRDTLEKQQFKLEESKWEEEFVNHINDLLTQIQDNLLSQAELRLKNNFVYTNNFEEFVQHTKINKFVVVPFEEDSAVEQQIQEVTGATARCIINVDSFHYLNIPDQDNSLFSKKPTKRFVLFAKAY